MKYKYFVTFKVLYCSLLNKSLSFSSTDLRDDCYRFQKCSIEKKNWICSTEAACFCTIGDVVGFRSNDATNDASHTFIKHKDSITLEKMQILSVTRDEVEDSNAEISGFFNNKIKQRTKTTPKGKNKQAGRQTEDWSTVKCEILTQH